MTSDDPIDCPLADTAHITDLPHVTGRTELIAGTMVTDRVRLRQPLGAGGMGSVWTAEHLTLDIDVAVKFIHAARDESMVRRFAREARLAAKLDNPHIVKMFDYGVMGDGVPFIVMELLDGESLAEHLEANGPMSVEHARLLVHQVALVLNDVHGQGIVHRDIKPANIFLVKGPYKLFAKVLDFGIARRAEAAEQRLITAENATAGTPLYMAPEQFSEAQSGDEVTDRWSLAVVAYEALVGTTPFSGRTIGAIGASVLAGKIRPVSQVRHELSREIDGWFEVALNQDRSARFASVTELASTFSDILDGSRLLAAPRGAQIGELDTSPHAVPNKRRTNVSRSPDAFFGRADELEELRIRLRAGARLVTLVGIGGTGKTRLARQFARDVMEDQLVGSAWFADLSEARSHDGICHAVAAALGVALGKEPENQLGHAIRERGNTLIVLDNFEQIAEHAGSTLGLWASVSEDAAFLITSRVPLRIRGELVLDLEPLNVDDGTALFVDRSHGVVESDGTESVEALVAALDGLPLAIELAAARSRILRPSQIHSRLNSRFSFLSARPGSRSDRHTTLQATLDWSWDLLTDAERSALAQLSVFEGGFALESAEEIVDVARFESAPWLLDVLEALVDHSLVRVSNSKDRWSMLVTIHEYANDRLVDAERQTTEARHGEYFAGFGAREKLDALHLIGGVERLNALSFELDNLVAACERAISRGDGHVASSTALASWEIIDLRGPIAAGVRLLEAASRVAPENRKVEIQRQYSFSLGRSGKVELAVAMLKDAVAQARALSDRWNEGRALLSLSRILGLSGQPEEARQHLDDCVTCARSVGDRWTESYARAVQGIVAWSFGNMREAFEQTKVALDMAREIGDARGEGRRLGNLGQLLAEKGDLTQARDLLERACDMLRVIGDTNGHGVGLWVLASVCLQSNDHDAALHALEHSEQLLRHSGDLLQLGNLLCIRADFLREEGDTTGASEALDEAQRMSRVVHASHRSELGLNLAKRGRSQPENKSRP